MFSFASHIARLPTQRLQILDARPQLSGKLGASRKVDHLIFNVCALLSVPANMH